MPLPTAEEIGERLLQWRKEARESQERLGAATGLHQRTVSLMEKGQSLTIENLLAVLLYFEKGLEDLSRKPSENAPESLRTHSPAPGAVVPLDDYLEVVRALTLEIKGLTARRKDAPLPGSDVGDLGEIATAEPKPQSGESRTADSVSRKPHPPAHKKGRPS